MTDHVTPGGTDGELAAPPDHAQQPPQAQLFLLIAGKWVAQCVCALAELGVADLLASGPRTPAELAAETGTDELALYRVLRAVAVVNVFTELPDGRFDLTPQGECLRSDVPGSMRPLARLAGSDALWRPYGDLLTTMRTGEPAFPRVHGTTIYEYFDAHPELGAVFDDAMTHLSEESADLYVQTFDFGRFRTIADIGGGHGQMLAEILNRHPGTNGILFERPEVIAGADGLLRRTGIADRVTCVAGDFFEAVPTGADAYVLKTVLHNWNDDDAVRILKRVREAVGDTGAPVLVLEEEIQPLNAWDLGKLIDIDMLVNVGGRGRTHDEWVRLLHAAGFDLVDSPAAGTWTVLEGKPR